MHLISPALRLSAYPPHAEALGMVMKQRMLCQLHREESFRFVGPEAARERSARNAHTSAELDHHPLVP